MDRAYVSPTPLIWPVREVKTEVWVATEPTWLPSEYSFGETIQIKGKKPTSMIQSLYFIVLFPFSAFLTALLYKPIDRVTRSTLVLHVSMEPQSSQGWGGNFM